jgi:hypothetical protein
VRAKPSFFKKPSSSGSKRKTKLTLDLISGLWRQSFSHSSASRKKSLRRYLGKKNWSNK